ncbi:hypothetical protein LINPERPRIM_LOCUS20779 [Linum perenne]
MLIQTINMQFSFLSSKSLSRGIEIFLLFVFLGRPIVGLIIWSILVTLIALGRTCFRNRIRL